VVFANTGAGDSTGSISGFLIVTEIGQKFSLQKGDSANTFGSSYIDLAEFTIY
jgi:hypothetical protein